MYVASAGRYLKEVPQTLNELMFNWEENDNDIIKGCIKKVQQNN